MAFEQIFRTNRTTNNVCILRFFLLLASAFFTLVSIFFWGGQTLDRKFSNRAAITLPIHSDEKCVQNDSQTLEILYVYIRPHNGSKP
jgi:hypothetical protein